MIVNIIFISLFAVSFVGITTSVILLKKAFKNIKESSDSLKKSMKPLGEKIVPCIKRGWRRTVVWAGCETPEEVAARNMLEQNYSCLQYLSK